MPFNNTNLFNDPSVVLAEIDATGEGHQVLLATLHKQVALGNCAQGCSLAVPRTNRKMHCHLASVGTWTPTSLAYQMKKETRCHYSMKKRRTHISVSK